jgi:hypothetical protein
MKTSHVTSSILQRRQTLPPALWLAALVMAWAALAVASILLCGQGFIHPESYSFLPRYLSGKLFLSSALSLRQAIAGTGLR